MARHRRTRVARGTSGMPSHRSWWRRARAEGQGAAVSACAILAAASAARSAATRVALLGSVWLGALAIFAPNTAHAVDGTWTGPEAEWTVGTNWTSIPPNTVPDNTATFTNNSAPKSVTISSSTSINTIEFTATAPVYSFTVQNGATFTITDGIINNPSLEPAFTVNAGSALTVGDGAFVEIGSLAGGGRVTIGPSSSSSLLSIVGNGATTFSGTFSGAGSIELDNADSLTLTGASNGGNIGSIGGDLTLCSTCASPALTISGGSLTVGGSTIVDGGTLTVTNGGTLTTANFGVAGSAVITGAGSSVTVTGQTIVGNFAPASLTISNGGVLNSQGSADIATGLPFLGTPTVTVTGPGSTWNVGGPFGLSAGDVSVGPGALVKTNSGVVNSTTSTIIGDVSGSSSVIVTGVGSVSTASNSLAIGGGCGCNPVGTLTIADGGVVNSPGATSIGAGSTLNLGTGGLAGAIVTPAIANDGQIIANFTDALTLAAAISGAGALSKAGSGTLILTGSNTYGGGTTITGGTLQLGNGGASGSITGDVVDNGTFAINRSDTFAFGGVISGTGTFAQIGPGTTILTAANTYSGGTAINGGALAVAADANLGAASGGLAFGGGTLQFLSGFTTNRAVTLNAAGGSFDTNGNNAALGGPISGAGGLTKLGSGALTLLGSSSYTGATAVNAGTLRAGAANAFAPGSAFTVAAGAALDLNGFNQSIGSLAGAGSVTVGAATLTTGSDNTSTTFSGTISGTGGLTKIGAGALTLTGVSSYTGATAVNGGTLSPGNSIGTLTVNGSLVMTAAAAYIVEVSPSNADRTNVGGTATLGGTVQAAFASGGYVTRAYTILSAAGGLNGTTFNALTTSNLPANFTTSLSYTATDVILNLTAALGALTPLGAPSTCAFSINQCNVANAINAFFNNGGALPGAFANLFGLTGVNLGNALTLLSGEAATGAQQGAFQLTNQFLGVMLDPFVDGRNSIAGAGGPTLG